MTALLRRRAAGAALAGLCTVAIFTVNSRRPDEDLGPAAFLHLALAFLVWLASLAGWGRLLSRRFAEGESRSVRLLLTIAAGALAFSLGAALLGAAGLLHERWLFGAVVGTGLIFLPRRFEGEGTALSPLEKAVAAAVGVLLAVRLVQAAVPASHGDALYYHLVGPKLWAEFGAIRIVPELPLVFQCATWEYLAIWPAALFASAPGRGLVELQIFAQMAHVVLGLGGSALALFVLGRVLGCGRLPALLFSLAGLAPVALAWTASTAKNDWGIAFWTIAGLALLLENRPRAFAAGLLFGAAFSGKYTAAVAILPGLAVFVARRLRSGTAGRGVARELSWVAGGILLAAAPVLARNALATGDPIFPMTEASGALLSATFHEHMSGYRWGVLPDRILLTQRLAELLRQGPFVPALLLSPLLALGAVRRRAGGVARAAAVLAALALGGVGLYAFGAGPAAEVRLLGPILALVTGSSCLTALALLRGISARVPWEAPIGIVLLATSSIPVHRLARFPGSFPLNRAIADQTGAAAKAWVRLHVPAGSRIASTGENEVYMLSGYRASVVPEDPALDAATRSLSDPAAICAALASRGYRWVLDSALYDGSVRPGVSEKLRPALDGALAGLVVYRDARSYVLDLTRLSPQ